MNRASLCFVTAAVLAVLSFPGTACRGADAEEILSLSKQGQTLAPEVAAQYPLAEQRVSDDTGINVLNPQDLREQWGKGKEWTKIWWVWQKLDDRYGPTWYPRWRWVQYTRWQDQPQKKLTWDETVEDMSIAVGEDLFPFFRRIGTTLKKDRFPRAVFQDTSLDLPEAPLTVSPAGPVCLGPIGDYRQPLKPNEVQP